MKFLIFPFLLYILSCTPAPITSISDTDSRETTWAPLSVSFIDVGQGDAILVQNERKNVLIDAGTYNRGSDVHEFITTVGNVDTLHTIIATHPHADHIGGLIHIIDNIPVLEVIDPGVTHTTATYQDYITAIETNDINHTIGRAGMTRELCDITVMRIVHPVEPSEDHLNNSSIVAHVTNGTHSFLFTGDTEAEAEAEMLQRGEYVRADVLKVGHHGSRTSTTAAFLNVVRPQIAVVMCGEGNRYGHPHTEVTERLEAIGTEVYQSNLDGTVRVVSDREELRVERGAVVYSLGESR